MDLLQVCDRIFEVYHTFICVHAKINFDLLQMELNIVDGEEVKSLLGAHSNWKTG